VIENWNSASNFIFYGKSGEIATNRLVEQEVSILCLHQLQICLVYVNTLMIQEVLDEQSWTRRMTAAGYRGLSPLIYLHVNPNGRFSRAMYERLALHGVG
jgi:TnpA family transposase